MDFVNRLSRKRSEKLFAKAKKLFPGGVNSPKWAFKSLTGAPLFVRKGEGSKIWDEDGNEYIDFCGSWGSMIIGHNNIDVQKSIVKTVKNGCSFGSPTKLGIELGELITNNHRFVEKIRFVSSGTEAVMTAIRAARGFTGRNKILKFEGCYHGHIDSLMGKAGSGLTTFDIPTSSGIPEALIKDTYVLPLNDLVGVESLFKSNGLEIAAVIIEPIPANNGLLIQDNNYLAWLRKLCDDYKILLIFDESISGFRIGFEGAAGYYSIAPDLITFSNIIGGSLPLGAYGGKAEIMSVIAPEGPVYQTGTLSENPVAMAAGLATLKQLLKPGWYEHIDGQTSYLVKKLNEIFLQANVAIECIHLGSIFWLKFSKKRIFSSSEIDHSASEKFKIIHHELLQRNIYLGPSIYEVGFVSNAHTFKDLDVFISAMEEIVVEYKQVFK